MKINRKAKYSAGNLFLFLVVAGLLSAMTYTGTFGLVFTMPVYIVSAITIAVVSAVVCALVTAYFLYKNRKPKHPGAQLKKRLLDTSTASESFSYEQSAHISVDEIVLKPDMAVDYEEQYEYESVDARALVKTLRKAITNHAQKILENPRKRLDEDGNELSTSLEQILYCAQFELVEYISFVCGADIFLHKSKADSLNKVADNLQDVARDKLTVAAFNESNNTQEDLTANDYTEICLNIFFSLVEQQALATQADLQKVAPWRHIEYARDVYGENLLLDIRNSLWDRGWQLPNRLTALGLIPVRDPKPSDAMKRIDDEIAAQTGKQGDFNRTGTLQSLVQQKRFITALQAGTNIEMSVHSETYETVALGELVQDSITVADYIVNNLNLLYDPQVDIEGINSLVFGYSFQEKLTLLFYNYLMAHPIYHDDALYIINPAKKAAELCVGLFWHEDKLTLERVKALVKRAYEHAAETHWHQRKFTLWNEDFTEIQITPVTDTNAASASESSKDEGAEDLRLSLYNAQHLVDDTIAEIKRENLDDGSLRIKYTPK